MSERVGVSSVGVSGVSGVSRVSDVSDRRTCVLGPLDLCPGTVGPVSWDPGPVSWDRCVGVSECRSVGVSECRSVGRVRRVGRVGVSEFDTIDTR